MPSRKGFLPEGVFVLLLAMLVCFQGHADDLLVKVKPGSVQAFQMQFERMMGAKVEVLTDSWIHLTGPSLSQMQALQMQFSKDVILHVQPNFKLEMTLDVSTKDPVLRKALLKKMQEDPPAAKPSSFTDNPEIPALPAATRGSDPLLSKQWGMFDLGVKQAWRITRGSPSMIVAVIDTGVDYTHEDLLPNIWRNPGETGLDSKGTDKSKNGIDDDRNGYIDDVVGWDFASDDNKPYDLSTDSPIELILTGGNPGHGTHCAGNVGARADNGLGIAGVAPDIKIMAIRFLTEKGQGTTSGAIKSIKYALDNGAKILSNSWGAAGEDPNEAEANKALKEIIKYAQEKGVLFVAAAGNGRGGVGYNNDTDSQPVYPASYSFENIISVAALDAKDSLGKFSNWGAKTVDLGAPGVKIMSTVPGNRYQDNIINMPDFGIVADWDGTSMATPLVAGAAALYWSAHPDKNWREVKKAILDSTLSIPALSGKAVSYGKLNVEKLLR